MAVLETKYSIGDTVYFANVTTEARKHDCPDCLGAKTWKAVSPAGGEYDFACPRCAASYNAHNELSLTYTAYAPTVAKMTIGSIKYNTHHDSYDSGAQYMCRETGVGSGNIYGEDKLFPTHEEALVAAELHAAKMNSEKEWIVNLYNKTLSISDYQLDNGALKAAKDFKSRVGSLLWNINDVFEQIAQASDLEGVIDMIDDYKRYHMERDVKAVDAMANNA